MKQIAPDAAMLVEALESIVNGTLLDEHDNRDDNGMRHAAVFGSDKGDLNRWQGIANKALAAYNQKFGGERQMNCVHCGEHLPEDVHDKTFCNYDSPRYSNGTHTGNIYKCDQCEEYTIELVQEGGKLESWSY